MTIDTCANNFCNCATYMRQICGACETADRVARFSPDVALDIAFDALDAAGEAHRDRTPDSDPCQYEVDEFDAYSRFIYYARYWSRAAEWKAAARASR